MYMSYCMYEGTKAELKRCLDVADEHIEGSAEYPVSQGEVENFVGMVEMFYQWMEDNYLINLDGELDRDELNTVAEAMKRKFTDYMEDDDV